MRRLMSAIALTSAALALTGCAGKPAPSPAIENPSATSAPMVTLTPTFDATTPTAPTTPESSAATAAAPSAAPKVTPTIREGVKVGTSATWTNAIGDVQVTVFEGPRMFAFVDGGSLSVNASIPVEVTNNAARAMSAADLAGFEVRPMWKATSPVCAANGAVDKVGSSWCVLKGDFAAGKYLDAGVPAASNVEGSYTIASPSGAVGNTPAAALVKAAQNPDAIVITRDMSKTKPAAQGCTINGITLVASSVPMSGCS